MKHFPEYPPYVILDDDSDMLLEQRNCFVHTNGRIGLTDEDVVQATDILTGHLDRSKAWYAKAYEALRPLRYHMHQMIYAADSLRGLNLFHKEILEAAREADEKAESFFTRKV